MICVLELCAVELLAIALTALLAGAMRAASSVWRSRSAARQQRALWAHLADEGAREQVGGYRDNSMRAEDSMQAAPNALERLRARRAAREIARWSR